MTVDASPPAPLAPIRVTRPSAGETTTSGSDGGTRFGSRKKNAIKSVNRKRNPATYQKPSTAAATPSSTGITIYGILSFTIRNAGTYGVEGSQTADHKTTSQRPTKLTIATFLNFPSDVKGDANSWFYVPFNLLAILWLGETAAQF